MSHVIRRGLGFASGRKDEEEPMDGFSSTISVIIPAYNAEAYLAEALESVLAQGEPIHEVIVVDDGSTDRTAEVAAKFGAPIRYLRQDNAGASAARNHGIREATGEWIAFLDADDLWEPHRLSAECRILEANPDLVWVAGEFAYGYIDGSRTCRVATPEAFSLLSDQGVFDDFYAATAAGVVFSTCSMLIRRDVFDEIGGFDESLITSGDRDLWYRIGDQYPQIGFVSEPLFLYRMVADSLQHSFKSFTKPLLMIFERHISPGVTYPAGVSESKALYFRGQMGKLVRHALRIGDHDCLRRVLRDYRTFLTPRARLVARIGRWVPRWILRFFGSLVHRRRKTL
jgi:glycosyltransferase involved in cell wall biosynthesis